MKYITVTSSNVAKYTGHNKFDSLEKTVNELLSKNGIKDVYIPRSNLEEILLSLSEQDLTLLKQELDIPQTYSLGRVESHIKLNIMTGSYAGSLTEQQSKELIDEKMAGKPILQGISGGIKQDLRMRRGNIKENKNLDKIQTKEKIQITQRNSTMYTKELYRCPTYVILLRGKVDGQTEDTVIESKNRTKKLFMELRDYERVQMECYMCLTGHKRALLTEHYNDTEHCIECNHDEEFWQECLDSIITFMDTHIAPCLSE
jgi:hypothetical protein